jgi:Na+/alanine symporter
MYVLSKENSACVLFIKPFIDTVFICELLATVILTLIDQFPDLSSLMG